MLVDCGSRECNKQATGAELDNGNIDCLHTAEKLGVQKAFL